jgi:hypothetical protein
MAVINLTFDQRYHVMKPLCEAMLPAMGCMRHFPKALVHAPACLLRLGITHPCFWTIPAITRRSGPRSPQTIDHRGPELWVSLQQLQLYPALSGSATDWDWNIMEPVLTDCWLKSLISFMVKCAFHLEDDLRTIPLIRTDDQHIIQEAINFGHGGTNPRLLMECRTALCITTLADITTADGLHVEEWNSNGQPQPQQE